MPPLDAVQEALKQSINKARLKKKRQEAAEKKSESEKAVRKIAIEKAHNDAPEVVAERDKIVRMVLDFVSLLVEEGKSSAVIRIPLGRHSDRSIATATDKLRGMKDLFGDVRCRYSAEGGPYIYLEWF